MQKPATPLDETQRLLSLHSMCILDTPSEERFDRIGGHAILREDELDVASKVSIDELTRVANRRGFNMVANHMVSLCRRKGIAAGDEFVVLMTDSERHT